MSSIINAVNATANTAPTRAVLSTKQVEKVLTKMKKDPDIRTFSLSANGNLVIRGRSEKVISFYLVATPWGTWAKLNGVLWTPQGQKVEMPTDFAAISDSKCFLRFLKSGIPGLVWSKKSPPENGDFFLLFSWTEVFAEFFAVTPAVSDVLNILWPSDSGGKLLGLCTDLLKVYAPKVGQEFEEFRQEVIAYV